jgi:Tol biopolymer transport system component
MGEVYRARDTRLGRDVAIKVLPDTFAGDPERQARFEREAQAVAALSHPNIVAVFDTGVDEGRAFVVMELLDGQTLRARLDAGGLPLRKAIDVGVQIARGLAAAHGKQIVHRDLKPENVFLLEDGQVKLLDFGLAKALDPGSADGTAGATATHVAGTDPGTVMGTVGYMAPEQLRAQPIDARADLFAFGAVLYEMVSGQPAFRRDTAADTTSAILSQDPPELGGSRPEVSPALERIIRHCLEKNPNERFQSARDVAFALEALSGSNVTSGVSPAAPPEAPAVPLGRSPLVIAALVVAAAALGALGRGLVPTPEPEAWLFTKKTFEPQVIFNARFMPDDRAIVFSAALVGNAPGLFEIRPGTLEARPFGPPRTHLLSISSTGELAVLTDAHYIGHRLFQGTLARMALDGAPRPMLERVREADWGPDGSTLAIVRDQGTTDVLEYPVGTALYEASGYLSDPRVSPDGTRVAFMEHPLRYDDRGFVKVVDTSGVVTTLAGEYWGEEGLAWLPDGDALLFGAIAVRGTGGGVEGGSLLQQVYRVAADGAGGATQVLGSPTDLTFMDVSADGQWLANQDTSRYGIVARGRAQAEERDLSYLDNSWGPFLSRDGTRLLFTDGHGGSSYQTVWRDLEGSPVVRLGEGGANGLSPDGRWALAMVPATSQVVIYPMGAGEAVKLDTSPIDHIENVRWFPDSRSIVILGSEPSKSRRTYRQVIDGGRPEPILPEEVIEALFAPDGTAALGVTGDGAWSIYPTDGSSPRPVAEIGPDDTPFGWSEDGRWLFVQDGSDVPARVDRIDVATGRRTHFREFAPAVLSGLIAVEIRDPVLPADGSRYSYQYVRTNSTLFLATPAGR